jgi:NAD(P)-dependent dehydrogenase (short-subunit alcohol dehydrogenase family)
VNILVLGASSAIGSQLAWEFAPGSTLLLVGRNFAKLEHAAQNCRENRAAGVKLLATDLESGYAEIERAAILGDVELVINAASATSRLRDHDLDIGAVGTYVAVDLVGPVRLIQALSSHRGVAPLGVIFVSSLLAVVRSPNRLVYGSLKAIHELFLRRILKSQPERRLLIVRVGKPLPTDEVTENTVLLARAARKAFEERRSVLFYGFTGRMLSWLYLAQPLVFRLVVEFQRKLRRSS